MAPRRKPAADALDRANLDPSTRFFYTPHTVTFLALGTSPAWR